MNHDHQRIFQPWIRILGLFRAVDETGQRLHALNPPCCASFAEGRSWVIVEMSVFHDITELGNQRSPRGLGNYLELMRGQSIASDQTICDGIPVCEHCYILFE